MKNGPLYVTIACLVIVIAIQSLSLSQTSRSFRNNEKQLQELSVKLDRLQPAANEKVITALTSLQDEIIRYRAEQNLTTPFGTNSATSLSNTLDEALATLTDQSVLSPYAPLVKVVKLKPDWKNVDVYQQAKASSKVLGTATTNQNYVVTDEQPGWYQIRLDSVISGWLQSQFVYEAN